MRKMSSTGKGCVWNRAVAKAGFFGLMIDDSWRARMQERLGITHKLSSGVVWSLEGLREGEIQLDPLAAHL